jgi:SAM-dependent methyltransferase
MIGYKTGYLKEYDLKLHLGCGSKKKAGYVNVDLWITDATDIICNVSKLPWPDNSVNIIENYHIIEHISHTKIIHTLREWKRVLKPGGKLVIECPNFDVAVQEYLTGNEKRLINIFGWQRRYGDTHLYGYNPPRLIRLLEDMGFENCVEADPESSQTQDEPCLRVECNNSI